VVGSEIAEILSHAIGPTDSNAPFSLVVNSCNKTASGRYFEWTVRPLDSVHLCTVTAVGYQANTPIRETQRSVDSSNVSSDWNGADMMA
jgi:hypothetical protein